MDLKAKHHKLGSQGLRGAQQTSPCKKKNILKKNKNTKTNGDQKIIIIKRKKKDQKEKEEKNSRQVQFMAQDYKTGHTGGRKELL